MFPSLWSKIDGLTAAGEIISSEEVYLELKRKDDDLHDWIQARKQMLVPLDEAIQLRAAALLKEFPRLVDTLRGRSKADPFVIATAMERGAVVPPIVSDQMFSRIWSVLGDFGEEVEWISRNWSEGEGARRRFSEIQIQNFRRASTCSAPVLRVGESKDSPG